jgi:hypothetical protein
MAVSTIDALYNGTSEKLTTSATGITVTGTVAATAYTGDGSALTGTGSPSIDDNGNATAMTIDSLENVLIGKTSSSYNTVGSELLNNGVYKGLGQFTTDGFNALTLNRKSSDGDIIVLRKDGTAVGSIGNDGVNLTINSASTGHLQTVGTSRYYWDDAQFYPANTNSKNLGHPSYQFKDLYLSGGIYLGGTGSANKLEDYEEGTFTPLMQGSTTNPSYGGGKAGRYTKIGNIVHFSAYVDMNPYNSNGNGNIYFAGLPFTVDGSDAGATRNISLSIWGPTIGSGYSISGQPVNNSNYLQFALWGDNRNQVVWTYSTASFSSGDAIYIQGHYFTNS